MHSDLQHLAGLSPQQLQSHISDSLQAELKEGNKGRHFEVTSQKLVGGSLILGVKGKSMVDEGMEGMAAVWRDPSPGRAEVLAAFPDDDALALTHVCGRPPNVGERFSLFPPAYLESLVNIWSTKPRWVERCHSWLQQGGWDTPAVSSFPTIEPPKASGEFLRDRQLKAFDLLRYRVGFLWGPPGTGKTVTLGHMVAAYMLAHPEAKVLLLSSTHVAVDEMVLRVDQALSEMGPTGSSIRSHCYRMGKIDAEKFKGRHHLLPPKDQKLLQSLAEHQLQRPKEQDVERYRHWKERLTRLEAELDAQVIQVYQQAHLMAMTCMRAAYSLERFTLLNRQPPFDLVLFDEASQVSLPMALSLAPLGNQCVFAGDPKQLGPIFLSRKDPDDIPIQGRSPFDLMDPRQSAMVFLNEQSRMAEPIAALVSRAFYPDEQLKVAERERMDPKWRAEREAPKVKGFDRHVYVRSTDAKGESFGESYTREQTAVDMVGFLEEYIDAIPVHEKVLVVTPFRFQRSKVRSMLRTSINPRVRQVAVSTVHRAQGQEYHTVLFDPVYETARALVGEQGERLINVAASRAKARLLVFCNLNHAQNNPVMNRFLGNGKSIQSTEEGLKADSSNWPIVLEGWGYSKAVTSAKEEPEALSVEQGQRLLFSQRHKEANQEKIEGQRSRLGDVMKMIGNQEQLAILLHGSAEDNTKFIVVDTLRRVSTDIQHAVALLAKEDALELLNLAKQYCFDVSKDIQDQERVGAKENS